MHFKTKHYFIDTKSQDNFFAHYDKFKLKNKKDSKQDYSYGFTVPGLIERRAFYINKPCCDYLTWMYVFGAIGLLWPFTLFVESRIGRYEVQLIKVATVDKP